MTILHLRYGFIYVLVFPICVISGYLNECPDSTWLEPTSLETDICYKLLSVQLSYVEGRNACLTEHALATFVMPRTDVEYRYIKGKLGQDTAWIGLTDDSVEGVFVWQDGELYNSTPTWAPGMPTASGTDLDCVVMGQSTGFFLEDRGCVQNYTVICQIILSDVLPSSHSSTCDCPTVPYRLTTERTRTGSVTDGLTLDRRSLSSFRRRKMSVDDPRVSAHFIGWSGVIVICICLGAVGLIDLLTFIMENEEETKSLPSNTKRKKSKTSRSNPKLCFP